MIMVGGASGKLGRRVLQLLLERVDAARVVGLSRTPECVHGVAARHADYDDPEGLVRAFAGAERLLLISAPMQPGAVRIRQHANAIRAAVRAGVGHVLYTSIARATDPANPAAVAVDHGVTEATLATSGLTYTVLRNSQYAELVLAGAPAALSCGMLLDNCGTGAVSYIAREDCAQVAATLLAEGGHANEVLEVTGAEALTQADVAALLTDLTGVPVRYLPLTDEQAAADLIRIGMPPAEARSYASIGRAIREGFTGHVTDVVERVTGRRPTPVAEFLAANRAVLTTA